MAKSSIALFRIWDHPARIHTPWGVWYESGWQNPGSGARIERLNVEVIITDMEKGLTVMKYAFDISKLPLCDTFPSIRPQILFIPKWLQQLVSTHPNIWPYGDPSHSNCSTFIPGNKQDCLNQEVVLRASFQTRTIFRLEIV